MQVFISYSHNAADTPLARYLAACFRAIGITVWQDESSQAAGVALGADIEKALEGSQAVIFLVSPLWIESDWCKVELDRVYRLDQTAVRRVPIYRSPVEQLKLPPALISLKGITWLPETQESADLVWQVYCALTGTAPGPQSGWVEEGRKLLGGNAPRPPIAQPKRPSRESLLCDRSLQWGRITSVAPEPQHDLLIVPGQVGQAHDHLCLRVRELLPDTPARNFIWVNWNPRPSGREEYLDALARSLDPAGSQPLPLLLAKRMSQANLVLLHQCVTAQSAGSALVSYYTTWLPEVLAEAHPGTRVKCVQPIEWDADPAGIAGALSWLRLKPESASGRSEAERLIAQILDGAPPTLRSIRLQDLSDVTQADLEEFCQSEQLTGAAKTRFLELIEARHPQTSLALFEAIDQSLPKAREANIAGRLS